MFAGIYFGIIVLLNVLIWHATAFCDWYSRYVTPVFVNTYGRLTALVPFSLGEFLIIAGILLCLVALLAWIPLKVWPKKKELKQGIFTFYRVFVAIVLNVAMIMTLNCFLLYHCSPIDPNPDKARRDYTEKEMLALYNHITTELNTLSAQMERDEKDMIIYRGDIQAECRKALKKLGAEYPKLDGWYPKAKNLTFSDIVSQTYTSGVFFPFTLEANVNANMYIANYPEVYCHELAHLRGYIYEDEANWIAYLACISSDDPFVRYSGYLAVYWYVLDDCNHFLPDGWVNEAVALNDYSNYPDSCFLLPETWERIEKEAIISTDTMDSVSDKFTDTSLKFNGVTSGIVSYSEVVGHLLEYYDGILYGTESAGQ